jgi:hypothetical protein
MDKAKIKKELGEVGLIRFGMKKNIAFVPISLQGIKPPAKPKWQKLLQFFGLYRYQEYEYKYKPEESLSLNILRYAVIAGTFTTEEIRYVFGKKGEQELEKLTAIGYLNKGFPSQITEKQWEEFTARKR